jgi:putative FmdB family regulatory protein
MPIYEYECNKCDEKFSLRRNISDKDEDIKCPQCGAKKPKRLFSTFATGSSCQSGSPSGGG